MVSFPFRETRIESNLPVWIGLQEIGSQNLQPGKLEATLINVSIGGACILTPKLLIEGKHLFFNTLNNKYSLSLKPHESLINFEEITITARSVWMDSCQHMGKQHFKVGVCFLHPQKKFFHAVKEYLPPEK